MVKSQVQSISLLAVVANHCTRTVLLVGTLTPVATANVLSFVVVSVVVLSVLYLRPTVAAIPNSFSLIDRPPEVSMPRLNPSVTLTDDLSLRMVVCVTVYV
uniref:Uncharacterized protein n=1 Tax=Ixodes ricinus TaxID=34613 RepID=A0A6B0UIC5_IXORI